jgi:hypothetical protein
VINFAIRYRPIVQELCRLQTPLVLDVGSGPEGLAMFWRGAVIGTDLGFKRPPLHHAVRATSLALPFAEASCTVVVGCDVLEHLPADLRRRAVLEMARVASRLLMLSFPSGEPAMQVYRQLAHQLAPALPVWLQEHITNGLPEGRQVAAWLLEAGWSVSTVWYESAAAHARLMRWESRRPVALLTYGAMRLCGRWLGPRMPVPAQEPYLRVLVKAERNPPAAGAGFGSPLA